IFLMRLGWVGEAAEVVCEPVPGVASRLKCRGQVIETTRVAAYEVFIKELGYRPQPYALADAIMYADGKPIVEITDMALQMTGVSEEKVRSLWRTGSQGSGVRGQESGVSGSSLTPASCLLTPGQALFDRRHILAFAPGKPSEAFGEPYRIF